MNFKLACADFAFPLLTHEQSLRLISMLGFEGVDIGLFDGDPTCGRHESLRTSIAVRPHSNGSQMESTCRLRTSFCNSSRFSAVRHQSSGACSTPVGPRLVLQDVLLRSSLHVSSRDSSAGSVLRGRAARAVPQTGRRRIRAGERNGLGRTGLRWGPKCMWAHSPPIRNPQSGWSRRSPDLTLTLDYTHFTRAGMPDDEVLQPLLPFASHFHVRGARTGRLQAAFKDNAIDYRRVVDGLRAAGYAGWLGVEYVWIDWEHCNECDNLSETILFRDFLEGPWSHNSVMRSVVAARVRQVPPAHGNPFAAKIRSGSGSRRSAKSFLASRGIYSK